VANGKNAIVYCDGAGAGAAVVDAAANLALATLTTSGDITASGTVNVAGDTAASDSAAIGYAAAEGLILTGQGSTNDVTIKNDADAEVFGVPTGTTGVTFQGVIRTDDATDSTGGTSGSIQTDGGIGAVKEIVTDATFKPLGDTAASDAAAIGYTAAEGLILTGQGSTNDITLKNDADAEVCGVPTGTDDLRFPDDAKAEWGAGGDLQIYHDASNSYIVDSGTGNLKIAGSQIDLLGGSDGAETMATFADDGAVTLYYDNSTKIATTSVGATVTGTLIATTDTEATNTGSVTLDFGANQNFVLTFTGNVTLENPSTEQVGQAGVIVCIQDATGSRTLTLGTDYETAGGSGITLSTDANAVDVIPYFVKASASIQLGAVQKAFS